MENTDMPRLLTLLSIVVILSISPLAAGQKALTLVVLGDSLSAGYRLAPGDGFPEKLAAGLKARGHLVKVINAGVSGDTTRGGLARLDWSVPSTANAVIVELGGNDALRGIDPAISRKTLDQIITRLKQSGKRVLLAGMKAPPNLGAAYGMAFNAIYPDLAGIHKIPLYPFFLEGVAADPDLNLDDGIHPNARGVDVIVSRILPSVEGLLRAVSDGDGGK